MPYERDPLSIRYDATARQSVMRAIAAGRRGRGVQVWVASGRGEAADAGGRTPHERAFSRAAYYLVWRAPINAGRIPDWSLKLIWGPDSAMEASSHGRMARPVRLRVWPRGGAKGGREFAYAMPAARQWARNEDLRSGGQGSPFQRFP